MKPRPFEYHRASSIEDAIAALASMETGRGLAGGQSLIPMMNLGLATPDLLVDVGNVPDLRYVRFEDGILRIGALVTHNAVIGAAPSALVCPMLILAYQSVAHHTIRNRGTLGGNICIADPAAATASDCGHNVELVDWHTQRDHPHR
ncbi:FAD binding domain-containing protein [Bradyrhizobium sp. Gha]|uniref:FAD binding domain-containing protein n=1 Tax=Bradyrhizobium sp. Gha TaxID=1855318 RepID=UPI0008E0DB45|nr:FAD binding domain-containing protein [Bradyrhizobium sp. Gha]SFI10565.1 carbon-monoxide dehydrogenase medium subunit [Bradyrhizobium sp. Gha]